jgi:hypothetical protein
MIGEDAEDEDYAATTTQQNKSGENLDGRQAKKASLKKNPLPTTKKRGNGHGKWTA